MLFAGIDLGGTNMKAGLFSPQGVLLGEASRPTDASRGAQAVCMDMADIVRELVQRTGRRMEEVAGIGVGCPGTVEADTGIILYSNNLAWENYPLGARLAAQTGCRVTVGNDANVAALGEAAAGCGKNAHSLVVLTLGTGVGSGVVIGGRVLTGYTGAACEIGHMAIQDGGALCTCGRRGCLEAYASATALLRMTRDAMREHPESSLCRMGEITGKTAFDAAQAGDAAAQRVVEQYIHFLAVGVANVVNIFFPEVIGFSGGVANQGEALLAPLRREVEAMTFGNRFASKKTRLTVCTLGYRAGLIGAGTLAIQAQNA